MIEPAQTPTESTRLSMTGALWTLRDADPARVSELSRSTGLAPAAARVLAQRWDGPDLPDVSTVLEPTLEHLHDPRLMMNMPAALERLERALQRGERIRVVTDYDVDGTTSSLILQAALRLRNPSVDVSYHIPNRFDEGYGFSVQAAHKAAEDGVDLIVTADIGVRDHAAVQAAGEAGIDVLICDHHLPEGASVPEGALVLCPPQLGDPYPNRSLAACGVSLKLAQGLLQGHHPKWDLILRSLLKLGAVGTVADMVPLTTLENRAIVAMGLQSLNAGGHHPGLDALIKVCRISGPVRTSDLGFRIGPRINAAGRVADAKLVVELLNCREPVLATQLAGRLDALNTERRDIQKRLVTEALEQIGDTPDPFVLLSGREDAGWHRGVVGIVAARVKDDVFRPTAIVSIDGDRAVGSVRSIPGVHAVEALDSARDLLVKYGGHPAAAGFTVPTEHLDALRERLSAYVESVVDPTTLVARRVADAQLDCEAVTMGLHRDLSQLGPFGMGNPQPRLWVRDVQAMGVQTRASGRLLKFSVPRGQAGGTVEALWWDHGEDAEHFESGPHDLLATLAEDRWQGRSTLQLQIKDARPS